MSPRRHPDDGPYRRGAHQQLARRRAVAGNPCGMQPRQEDPQSLLQQDR